MPMKKFSIVGALTAIFFLAGAVARAQMSVSTVGVGPHGYDWLIGNWTCTNSMPTAMGGPASQTLAATRTTTGSVMFRVLGTGFDQTGYLAYAPKNKTWWVSFAYANGSYGGESTMQTGRKTIWTGSYFDAGSGQTIQIRDTYTMSGTSKYTDLSQYKSGAAWKSVYSGTCQKS
jgi:hypothetical protein